MLKDEIQALWKAIDKIVLEDKKLKPKTSQYEKYILAKKELIKESFVIRRLLGESKEALLEGVSNSPREYMRQSRNMLIELSRKNKALAETVVYSNKKTKKLLQLEALMFGDCLYNILSESTKPKYSVGLTLAEAAFDAAAKKIIDIAEDI